MNKLDMDCAFADIEISAKKADYMSRQLVSHCELDEGSHSDVNSALYFASKREDICLGAEIIRDYIDNINKIAKKIGGEI